MRINTLAIVALGVTASIVTATTLASHGKIPVSYTPTNIQWEEYIESDAYFLRITDTRLAENGNCVVRVAPVGEGSEATFSLDVVAAAEHDLIYTSHRGWQPKADIEASLRASHCRL